MESKPKHGSCLLDCHCCQVTQGKKVIIVSPTLDLAWIGLPPVTRHKILNLCAVCIMQQIAGFWPKLGEPLWNRKGKMGLKRTGKQNPTSLSQSKGDFTQLENTWEQILATFSLLLPYFNHFLLFPQVSLSPTPQRDCFCKVSAYFKHLPYDSESYWESCILEEVKSPSFRFLNSTQVGA